MSKIIDSLVQASIDSKDYAGVVLAKFYFPTPYRYCNAYQTVYWDEAGVGEEPYIGLGNLASVGVLSETNELAAQTIQLTLSGIPNATLNDVFSNDYIGEPVYLWYATLDKQTYAIEGGQNGPVLIFAGRMDFCNVEFGENANVILNATSRLADWERARGGRFNNTYQKRHVDPTDTGFRYVLSIQDKPISWGGRTLVDGGRGGGGGGGGGPGTGPRPVLR